MRSTVVVSLALLANHVLMVEGDYFNYGAIDFSDNGVTSYAQQNWGNVECDDQSTCVSCLLLLVDRAKKCRLLNQHLSSFQHTLTRMP